jgi:hypothetical protein
MRLARGTGIVGADADVERDLSLIGAAIRRRVATS